MFEAQVYENRRTALAREMRNRGIGRGVVLLHANFRSPRTYRDSCFPFRQDSSWLYFVGLDQPGMATTLDVEDGSATLFGEEPTMADLVWTGPRPSLGEYAALAGIGAFRSYDSLPEHLSRAKAKGLEIFTLPRYQAEAEKVLAKLLGERPAPRAGGSAFEGDTALVDSVVGLREIKDAQEVAALEQAAGITAEVHKALARALRPGWSETEAASFAARAMLERGATPGFETIATVRGETLHNHPTGRRCREGDLFLLDAGAELESGYSGDLTTSFPVSPRFTSRQKDLYSLLSRVFAAAIADLGPGRLFLDAHLAACRELARGLSDLGLMKGDPEEAVAEGAHALFFPHGLGHMIGLDVHDMESLGEDRVGYGTLARSGQFGLRSLRLAKALKPGMVHSVEPGIYFIPGLIDQWEAEGRARQFIDYKALEAWRGEGGMRLEEDWLVEPTGSRRLGQEFSRRVGDIEALRA